MTVRTDPEPGPEPDADADADAYADAHGDPDPDIHLSVYVPYTVTNIDSFTAHNYAGTESHLKVSTCGCLSVAVTMLERRRFSSWLRKRLNFRPHRK